MSVEVIALGRMARSPHRRQGGQAEPWEAPAVQVGRNAYRIRWAADGDPGGLGGKPLVSVVLVLPPAAPEG
jgi:hypothetical protein